MAQKPMLQAEVCEVDKDLIKTSRGKAPTAELKV
jgi:hypothetical protein